LGEFSAILPERILCEVLDVAKNDGNLKAIPIAVLTTSSDDRDIDAFFASGANSYIVKPATVEGIIRAVQELANLWSFRF
jgi:CheY-like chemotaxis protein